MASLGSSLIFGLFLIFLARFAYLTFASVARSEGNGDSDNSGATTMGQILSCVHWAYPTSATFAEPKKPFQALLDLELSLPDKSTQLFT